MTARIETRSLTRRMPSGARQLTILDSVDLIVPAAQMVAVVGPSGSGKSSLLGLLAGLDQPSSGEVLVDGVSLAGRTEDQLAAFRRERVGFVFQSFHLLVDLTALENVKIPLELAGRIDAESKAAEMLGEVGLGDRLDHRPSQLSGGEQQRVAVARAFAAGPDILFADEPTGNLDQKTGARVLELLEDLRQKLATTVVLVTHDKALAACAERQIHLLDGRIERDDSS